MTKTKTMVLALAGGLAALAMTAATASAALTPQQQALFDYAKCMRGKGVKIPDPVKQKDGSYAFPAISKSITDADGVRAKAQACAQSSGALGSRQDGQGAKGGAGGRGGFGDNTQFRAAFEKFQACMKAAGVTLPDRRDGDGPGDGPAGAPRAGTSTGKLAPLQSGGSGAGSSSGKLTPLSSGGSGAAGKKAGTTTTANGKPAIVGGPDDHEDDDRGEGRGGFRGGPGGFLGSNDPKVAAALKKCQSLLPQRPGGDFGGRQGGPGRGQAPATTTTAKSTAAKK